MGSRYTSTARLEARIVKELHATLKLAAALQNVTMIDFVGNAVREATRNAIEQNQVPRLSIAGQERFVEALLSPPRLAPALKRAFARQRKLIVE